MTNKDRMDLIALIEKGAGNDLVRERRTKVVGIFPSDTAVGRRVGALMLKQHDE